MPRRMSRFFLDRATPNKIKTVLAGLSPYVTQHAFLSPAPLVLESVWDTQSTKRLRLTWTVQRVHENLCHQLSKINKKNFYSADLYYLRIHNIKQTNLLFCCARKAHIYKYAGALF